jgi:hypothetical protein
MSKRPRSPAGEPMTLGNMRENGVRSRVVSCATRGPSPSFPWASLGLPLGYPGRSAPTWHGGVKRHQGSGSPAHGTGGGVSKGREPGEQGSYRYRQ